MVETLSFVCKILCGVFLVGGAANFGRVYLIQVSGKKQTLLLYSWRFSRYSASFHWLVHGHMTSNNETVSRQMP